ncbi:hypothetical protein MPSEU_000197800 [Mayamaea pseudoterrestris]|nr:hypothetical protein MPSEU_000197800 [Mayamaea pseudoterrestris]
MKFASSLLLAVLAVDSAAAYSAAFVPRCSSQQQQFSSSFLPGSTNRLHAAMTASRSSSTKAPSSSLSMLVETSGGMEELQELTEVADANVLSKQVRKNPSLWKLAGMASIPVGAALGFGLTLPTQRIAAGAVGAIVSGVAGAVGKSRLDALTESNAKPALAQAMIDVGISDPAKTKQALLAVKETFGVEDEDYQSLCIELYATYLQGMVKYNPVAKTNELKELQNVRQALGLNNLQVGEAHTMAAQKWYRQTCLFTPEEELDDPDHPDRQALDKLLFLTERSLREGNETEEAFRYEMTRTAKALGVNSLSEAMERVAELAEPFYQRALKSTRSKLGSQQVSATMLERARRTLGVSDATAKDMHVSCFNEEVRELLGLSNAVNVDGDESPPLSADVKFPENAQERLKQLQEVLGLSDVDASYEISNEATPLFQATALEAIGKVLGRNMEPGQAWSAMEKRRKELLVDVESSKTLVASIVMQSLGRPLEQANKFAKVNNEAAAFEQLTEALDAKEVLVSILRMSGWEDFDNFDQSFCNPWDKKSANGFLVSEERIKMYRIFLTRSFRKMKDGKITDEAYNRILEIKGLLGISDLQEQAESRRAFGPELNKAMQVATDEIVQDYTPELAKNMQSQIKAVVENLRLSDDYVREVGATFYSKAVETVSEKAPGGLPSPELFQALEALRELFHLAKEDVAETHMEHFGGVYKKSVLEAMGRTGVIRPEIQEGLNKLQDRLGVSETDCRKLFLQAVEEKMKPMAKWVGSEMERMMLDQKQLSQRRGRDMGEDLFQTGKGADGVLGLGAEINVMSDIMNLIDFYNDNKVAEEAEVTTKNPETGEEVTSTDTIYPVTALGCGAMDQELAELLYRQFVVGGFQAQGEKAARYEASRPAFGGILGLDKAKIEGVNSNIASTVYDNFVSNAMQTKGTLDQQDMMFLANIQAKLSITAEEGEKMLKSAQRKILSEEIDAIMDAPKSSSLRAFREKCNSMGVNLIEDVGISKTRLTRMFAAEITPALKSGAINANDVDILTEIQESLGMEVDECESIFESTLLKLSKTAYDLIKGELLRGREENTVDLIKELVRYAAFNEGDLSLEADEAVAYQIFNIYDATDHADEDQADVEKNRQLLKASLGLP